MKKLLIAVLMCLIAAQAVIAPSETDCFNITACIDGSDAFTIENGELKITHGNFAPIGQHSECDPTYQEIIRVSGIADTASVDLPVVVQPDTSYLIDGSASYPTPIEYLSELGTSEGRGLMTLNNHTLSVDDNAIGGSATYKLAVCGPKVAVHQVPEFGLIGAPVLGVLIAGFLLLKRKN
ncbi:MAG: hypothetical protein EPN86_00910 [Nanoarchaeota archaeon]|nr:MAG: hypothetical protein EPN86_00910 [Nanoarchaeota archaeon]